MGSVCSADKVMIVPHPDEKGRFPITNGKEANSGSLCPEIPNKNCIEVGGQFIDCRLPESGRLIVEALLRIQGVGGRRPGTNITNHVYNNQPSIGTKNSISTTQPTSGFNKDNGDTINKGKPKRAAWDLKGRLQDMEQLMKSSTVERENFLAKLTDYDSRIENLELEKQNLNQNLQKTQTVSQANQEEVDRLKDNLRVECEERSSERRQLENTIQDLEFKKSSLQRQNKSLESELSARQDELAGLKSTVSHLTSAHAGLEAQLSSTRLLLDDRNNRVTDLEAQVSEQKETIEELEQKLREGEMARRKLHNQVQELKGNIRVFCRVRPLIGDEIKHNGDSDFIHHLNVTDEQTLEVYKSGDVNGSTMSGLKGRGNGNFEFTYDRVFSPSGTQAEVFEEISQLAQSALDGYNVCVFAYGQTGSGKTFTMEGIHDNEELEGMIPRTVKHIFSTMKQLKDKGWTYKVEASFLEIYNETIRDLLASPKESKNLTYDIKLTDSKKNDTFVTNLKVLEVTNENKVHHLLHLAQQQRAVAATNMNERSSRSHSVFRLKLIGTNSKTTESCEGTLNLVDLAGSERLKESGSEGARLTETQNINKSLSNLGNVIMALGQKQSHIPYRNSKLTHLLQSSLGGNSKTLMFVNVSPLEMCFNETLNSLRFATKVNQCHIGTASKQVRK
ncbi:carboxy-terminal kinesin 2-like isoform X2 [Homarus americanus]|uniref:carboxy-terminal kinesin 2-like isoform X2 n=1 Tax=Homarus americanus TaxID=6706 RepID=UPI001C471D38|nr:carboxy-terminal kinesin 2-like isoform X2 [Homarus americanus]XP_042242982.1 carboxy-terminal kinesin 2-like isoform X2 [Homarus americanus]